MTTLNNCSFKAVMPEGYVEVIGVLAAAAEANARAIQAIAENSGLKVATMLTINNDTEGTDAGEEDRIQE